MEGEGPIIPDPRDAEPKHVSARSLGERRDRLASVEGLTPQKLLTEVFGMNADAIKLARGGSDLAAELYANYSIGVLRASEMGQTADLEEVKRLLEQRIIDIEDTLINAPEAGTEQVAPLASDGYAEAYQEPAKHPIGFTLPEKPAGE